MLQKVQMLIRTKGTIFSLIVLVSKKEEWTVIENYPPNLIQNGSKTVEDEHSDRRTAYNALLMHIKKHF